MRVRNVLHILIGGSVIASLLILNHAYGENTEKSLEQILDAISLAQVKLATIAMDVSASAYNRSPQGGWKEEPSQKLVQKYRRNGKLLETEAKRFVPDKKDGFQYDGFNFEGVWDGKRSLTRQGTEGAYTCGFVSNKYDDAKRIVFSADSSNTLDGFFPPNVYEGNYIDIFKRKPGSVRLRPSKEMVNQNLCDVIEADTPSGKYVIWIDPQNGYCIRQAEVSLDKDDLAWGKPLHQSSMSCNCSTSARKIYKQIKMEVKDVEVAKIGETFIPVSGTYINRMFFDDGSDLEIKYLMERSNIDLNPDFQALNAFKMDMPNGTIVYDVDIEGLEYQWNNGELTASVGKKLDAAVDTPSKAYRDDEKTSSHKNTPGITYSSQSTSDVKNPQNQKQVKAIWIVSLLIAIGVLAGAFFMFRKIRFHGNLDS